MRKFEGEKLKWNEKSKFFGNFKFFNFYHFFAYFYVHGKLVENIRKSWIKFTLKLPLKT